MELKQDARQDQCVVRSRRHFPGCFDRANSCIEWKCYLVNKLQLAADLLVARFPNDVDMSIKRRDKHVKTTIILSVSRETTWTAGRGSIGHRRFRGMTRVRVSEDASLISNHPWRKRRVGIRQRRLLRSV